MSGIDNKISKIVEEISFDVIDTINGGRDGVIYKILFKRNGRQFTYNYNDTNRRGVTFRNVVIDLFNHTQSVSIYSIELYMSAFGIIDSKEGLRRYNQSVDITNRALAIFESPKVINHLVERWQEERWQDRWERV